MFMKVIYSSGAYYVPLGNFSDFTDAHIWLHLSSCQSSSKFTCHDAWEGNGGTNPRSVTACEHTKSLSLLMATAQLLWGVSGEDIVSHPWRKLWVCMDPCSAAEGQESSCNAWLHSPVWQGMLWTALRGLPAVKLVFLGGLKLINPWWARSSF